LKGKIDLLPAKSKYIAKKSLKNFFEIALKNALPLKSSKKFPSKKRANGTAYNAL
jgi:hypothetical protein